MKIAAITSAIATVFALIVPARAHLGHVGEVAGHSHWIGIAAASAAAAIAIGLSALGKSKGHTEESVEAEGDEGEAASTDVEAKA